MTEPQLWLGSSRFGTVKVLSQEMLKEILHYDQYTGVFTWLRSASTSAPNGSIAGSITTGGYVSISINKKMYPAHRLAWLYMTGKWPVEHIDHINMKPSDNRWRNLREATHSENCSYFIREGKGIRQRPSGRWEARIRVNKREIYLGSFETKDQARQAFEKATFEHRGDFGMPG